MTALIDQFVNLLINGITIVDALPVYIRALSAGLLLVVLLRFFESRICEDEVLYSISFRKTAFVALLSIPLLVGCYPAGRIVVFVDELPLRDNAVPWGWLLILLTWAAGAAATLNRLIRAYLQSYRQLKQLPHIAADDKLTLRLRHWQQQLGITSPLLLTQGTGAQTWRLPGSKRIVFPAAALHWPASAQDVLLIRELCQLKVHHQRWHWLAQVIACCYWPITWVPRMHWRMSANFQLAVDALAESCYRDNLGYDRALKQIARNLVSPAASGPAAEVQTAATRLQQLKIGLRRYYQALASLWQPDPLPTLDFSALFAARSLRDQQRKAEPYDKVFWFVGQAVFLALLLTGPTLRQTPPEIEQDFSLPFEVMWMENFHRNQEREERQLSPDGGNRIPPKQSTP